MNALTLLVFSPAGHPDPAIAIAASRYGAVGVFDTGLNSDAVALKALEKLAKHARNPFGLTLYSEPKTFGGDELLAYVSRGLRWLVLDPATADAWRETLPVLRAAGMHVLIEMFGADAGALETAPPHDGWIVKGHESGGWVGEETSFVLLQWALAQQMGPVYVRGGIGLHTAAACAAAGAAGVVLDSQLLLLRESPVRRRLKLALRSLVGNETLLLGDPARGPAFRALNRPGFHGLHSLSAEVAGCDSEQLGAAVRSRCGWDDPASQILPLGQDAALAAPYAQRYGNVPTLLQALEDGVITHLKQAVSDRALAPDSPLAQDHGTKLPIVQGPMTRVSDVAGFAQAVAESGALPMVALALLRGKVLESLLEETATRLAGRPWGVGILGFAPADLREEQIALTLRHRPAFAIVAGGRPDQVRALEQQGIPGFLHVPSPRLLSMFLEQGSRRFIFEGRECGGHVGPLSSFMLWETMVDTLLTEVQDAAVAKSLHILFAGGIHDAVSAAMVATLAAPLTARGMHVGILVGTAYLFTEEIVATGAVVPTFQKMALACQRTVTLESGPGHASRGADTPFARQFMERRQELWAKGEAPETIREELDALNLGRLRIASKGIERSGKSGDLRKVAAGRQRQTGMYMLGQVAALRSRTLTLPKLHHELTTDACAHLDRRTAEIAESGQAAEASPANAPAAIAIIGIGAFVPGATDARGFWENIVEGRDAIGEIPPERWDWRLYFDADRNAPDKIYSRWGGFLADMPFDPLRFGLPPKAIPHLDPLQLMTLEVADRTLADAGYAKRPFARERASVILGASGGAGDVGAQYAVRAETPRFAGALSAEMAARLPEWSEDTFAGILLNVCAGRAANRFDFGGLNFTVDAACASSLTAVYQAVVELEDGRSDLVIAGGVDTVQGPFGYLCFSKAQALSPRGRCRTFDAGADGIVISEGIAMVALKRLADAERDGDRIYAVIQGYGGSSDGRARSMTAPHPDGQLRALDRAYAKAGYSPSSVGLFEAHGTGTVAGDTAELETVTRLLSAAGAGRKQSAIGSVKTLIGHTKATAGVAGLIKSALALYHRVLPPHRNVERPNASIGDPDSPLYLISEAQPWISPPHTARRAGVSAFGFGGTNFHMALEEYQGDFLGDARPAPLDRWHSELFLWRSQDRQGLVDRLEKTLELIRTAPDLALRDVAFSLAQQAHPSGVTAAIVAGTAEELGNQLGALLAHLRDPGTSLLPVGCHFSTEPLLPQGNLALLFPGQGSQYPDMLRELAFLFPEMIEALDHAERELAADAASEAGQERLAHLIYPPASFDETAVQGARKALMRTQFAQPAIGAIASGLWGLIRRLGLEPTMAAGHSYGEYAALAAAGVFDQSALLRLSVARGRCIASAGSAGDLGAMAAVEATRDQVETWLKESDGLVLANHNGPMQSVISGPVAAIEAFMNRREESGVSVHRLPVSAAFHSPLVAPARPALDAAIQAETFSEPQFPVFSNAMGAPYPRVPERIQEILCEHLASSVEFVAEVQAMYRDGARIFLEVGPGSVLTGMTARILAGQPHRAIAIDDREGGLKGLLDALGALWAEGVALDPEPLFSGRDVRSVDIDRPETLQRVSPPGPHFWWLNGSAARPAHPLRNERTVVPPATAATASATTLMPAATGHADHAPSTSTDLNVRPPTPTIPGQPEAVAAFHPNIVEASSMPEHPQHPAPETPHPGGDRVWTAYYETMRQFLHVQESVMLAYLGQAGRRIPYQPAASRTAQLAHASVTGPVPAALQDSRLPPPAPPYVPSPIPPTSAPHPAAPVAGPGTPPAAVPVVAPAPSTSVAVAPAEPAALNPEKVQDLLLDIVEDRTGYPRDMLGLDQKMEADLGIDSIKRVEIVGALLKALPPFAARSEASEALGSQKTLGGIISWLSEHGVGTAAASQENSNPFDQTGAVPEAVRTPLPRFVMGAHAESLGATAHWPHLAGVTVLIAGDTALSTTLRALFTAAGMSVKQIVTEDVLSPDSLAAQLADARALGPIVGLVHLSALDATACNLPADWPTWQRQTAHADKSLFLCLHQLAGDLPNGGRVLTATKLGGYLGRDGSHADLTAQGGGVGLLKSLHEEWPRLHAKAVDLDPMQPVEAQAQQIFAEFRNPGGRIEVGYPQGRRTIFRTTEKPLDHAIPVRLMPSAQWVILATGGARGITASILEGLAPFGVTLVLAGRSPEPSGEEDTALAGLTTIPDLRHHFIREARARNDSIRPADIDREVQRVVRARELHANLARLRALGAQLDYRVADLRDADTTIGLLQDVRARYGRLDGVIHAAGIIEDSLLADKTVESWERVFDTKADSTWLLCSALDPEKLGFLALFTSVAGRYGNRGQTDYAAANELMNRLAWSVRRRWAAHPVRVVAINWGPWAGSGMVSDATRQQFEARGVVPIAHDAGRAFFLDEILRGPLDAVEIIAGQGPWEKHESELALPQPEPVSPPNTKVENGTGQPAPLRSPVDADVPPSRWPLLWEPSPKAPRTNGDLHLYRTLSLEQDPYLMEHLLDGIPVLPAAAALELMAEAVAELWPDWQVNSVSDFRQLRGIRFDTAEVPVALVAKASTHGDAQGFEVGVAITPDPDGLPFYRATVHLSSMPLEPVPFSPPVRHEAFTCKPAEFYRDWLFHGPCFQTVTRVHGLDHLGLLADAAPTPPGAWRPGSWHDWLFDPGLIDAGPQMALVWTRAQWDRSALPNRFARVSRFGSVSGGALRMHFRVNASRDRDHVRADIAYFDAASGMIKLLVEGLECTASTALNRLGGGWHGEIRV